MGHKVGRDAALIEGDAAARSPRLTLATRRAESAAARAWTLVTPGMFTRFQRLDLRTAAGPAVAALRDLARDLRAALPQ